MVRKKQYNLCTEGKSEKAQNNEGFSALDSLAEVCLIYKSKKDVSTLDDDRSEAEHILSERIPRAKINNSWSNSRDTQEPASSKNVDDCYGGNNADVKAGGTPSLCLSIRTEIKKGKNVNMDYMRSDRLWTLCLRLDGAQCLKRLGFGDFKAQGEKNGLGGVNVFPFSRKNIRTCTRPTSHFFSFIFIFLFLLSFFSLLSYHFLFHYFFLCVLLFSVCFPLPFFSAFLLHSFRYAIS